MEALLRPAWCGYGKWADTPTSFPTPTPHSAPGGWWGRGVGFPSGQVPRKSRCVSEGDGEGPLQPSDGEGKVSVGLGHAGWGFAPELLPEAAQGQGAGIARGQWQPVRGSQASWPWGLGATQSCPRVQERFAFRADSIWGPLGPRDDL